MKLNVQKQDLWHDIMIQSLYRCDGVVDNYSSILFVTTTSVPFRWPYILS